MKNEAKRTTKTQGTSGRSEMTLRLAEVIERNLYAFVMREGMKALDVLLERERDEVCGERGRRRTDDQATRWGSAEGRLVLGGRRVAVRRPRARKDGSEVSLPSWEEFANEDPLNERVVSQMVVGVSTRNYERSVEEVPADLGAHGASKSAASRRFVEMTEKQVNEWLNRDLSSERIAVVMLDGIEVGGQSVVVALGIDEDGEKQPLGVWQGATENSAVCEGLLTNLVERGLDVSRCYLFVIDGGKALRKAIRTVFGGRGVVQRCQEHKIRNVASHLPKAREGGVVRTLRDAYKLRSSKTAKKRLAALASALESEYPDAAASLREGLDETLTVKAWGLPEALERTLSTTNPIENLNGAIRRVTRNVKRWRDGEMIRRWVVAGIQEATRGFRRLRGYKGMPTLLEALRVTERTPSIDEKAAAA